MKDQSDDTSHTMSEFSYHRATSRSLLHGVLVRLLVINYMFVTLLHECILKKIFKYLALFSPMYNKHIA